MAPVGRGVGWRTFLVRMGFVNGWLSFLKNKSAFCRNVWVWFWGVGSDRDFEFFVMFDDGVHDVVSQRRRCDGVHIAGSKVVERQERRVGRKGR